jgi:hypothetical protein
MAELATTTSPRSSVTSLPALDSQTSAADRAEVRAWIVLAQAELLDGWSSALSRSGNRIQVFASVASPERKQFVSEQLSRLNGVVPIVSELGSHSFRLDQLAPRRETPSSLPPLGEHWIRQTYRGDIDLLTNQVLQSSQKVLGYSVIRGLLLSRRMALKDCGCTAALEPLLHSTTMHLEESTQNLSTVVAPLLGEPVAPPPLLEPARARQLDAAILHVFSSASANSSSLDAEQSTIRRILALQ